MFPETATCVNSAGPPIGGWHHRRHDAGGPIGAWRRGRRRSGRALRHQRHREQGGARGRAHRDPAGAAALRRARRSASCAAAAIRRPGSLRVERREIAVPRRRRASSGSAWSSGSTSWPSRACRSGSRCSSSTSPRCSSRCGSGFVRHEAVRPRIVGRRSALCLVGLGDRGGGVGGPHPRRPRGARRAGGGRRRSPPTTSPASTGSGRRDPLEPGGVDVHRRGGVLDRRAAAVVLRLVAPRRSRSPSPGPFDGHRGAARGRWSSWIVVLGTVIPYGLVLVLAGQPRGHAHRPARDGRARHRPAIVAWIVLDEVLSGVQLFGAVLVIVGIVAAETARRAAGRGAAQRGHRLTPRQPRRRASASSGALEVERHQVRRGPGGRQAVDRADPLVDLLDDLPHLCLGRRPRRSRPRASSTSLRSASVGGRYDTPSRRSLSRTHQSSSWGRSTSRIGLPCPGSPSKSPRSIPSRTCRSIHVSQLTPKGLRSVTELQCRRAAPRCRRDRADRPTVAAVRRAVWTEDGLEIEDHEPGPLRDGLGAPARRGVRHLRVRPALLARPPAPAAGHVAGTRAGRRRRRRPAGLARRALRGVAQRHLRRVHHSAAPAAPTSAAAPGPGIGLGRRRRPRRAASTRRSRTSHRSPTASTRHRVAHRAAGRHRAGRRARRRRARQQGPRARRRRHRALRGAGRSRPRRDRRHHGALPAPARRRRAHRRHGARRGRGGRLGQGAPPRGRGRERGRDGRHAHRRGARRRARRTGRRARHLQRAAASSTCSA